LYEQGGIGALTVFVIKLWWRTLVLSLSTTECSVHEGKFLVQIAENGHSFELDCDESTLVEAVMRFIEFMWMISFKFQLLACSLLGIPKQI
jgi:hypothetical protein